MNDEERRKIREECNNPAGGGDSAPTSNNYVMKGVYAGPAQMQDIGSMQMVYAGPAQMQDIGSMQMVYAGPAQMQDIGSMQMVYAGPAQMQKKSGWGFALPEGMIKGFGPDGQDKAPVNGAVTEKKQIRGEIYCVCPECGACVSTKFCPECGTPLANAEKYKDCVICGTRLGAADKFCRECGAQLTAGESVKV